MNIYRIFSENRVALLVLILGGLCQPMVWAADKTQIELSASSPQSMIDFVKEAKQYALSVGRDRALEEFSNPNGQFTQGELYIYAYDYQGRVLAHGGQPALVGKDLMALKDPNGLAVIEELIRKVELGYGTLMYQWHNPVTKTVMDKLGYVEPVDDTYWIGSGVYTDIEQVTQH